jgi:hypothetical protein
MPWLAESVNRESYLQGMRMLFAAVLALAAIVPAEVAARPAPHLRIVGHTPLALHGDGFRPTERVTLRVTLGQEAVKRQVTTSANGSFSTEFKSLRLEGCKALHAEAAGSKGSRVSFTLETTLACPNSSTR